MDEKKPLIPSSDENDNTPADPPPSYVASARGHGIPLRQSATPPIRKGGPPSPPQPLELPIIQYMRSHRVILASASPRRRAMLAQLGLGNLEVRPSTKPEDLSKAELGPHGYVAATARQKALDVYQAVIAELEGAEAGAAGEAAGGAEDGDEEEGDDDDDPTEQGEGGKAKSNNNREGKRKKKQQPKVRPHPGGDPDLVIAADTVIVTRDGQVLEKPTSEAAHVRMLRHLRDTRVHRVLTAVCAVAPRADAAHPGYEMRTHVEETRVWFAREGDGLPDDVLERYARTREGADKAGGYAVQGVGGMLLVEKIDGAVDNVVGLPVRRCLQLCEKVVFRQDEESDEESGEEEGPGGW
ncbi:hypothetical protein DL764_008326 [Monosporascus ibericus]|uniref:Uncharacterized protein n=1 Tax=Monosporascus ibericus TaxID=155417 RepID=A0A4Q4SZZ6_9PEZI|nr:hypothetical protein DL764_008326 [Monosporascus ibericus]